jgi:ribonuclease HI
MDFGLFADETNWSGCPAAGRLASEVGQQSSPDRIRAHQNIRPAMPATTAHYLLYTEATRAEDLAPHWKFTLQSAGGKEQLTADDTELNSRPSRLELLAVVRGLEAIDEPAQVTLLTASRYVARGIRRQLSQWREDNWQWERFGEMVPIRDRDLWQRIDHALRYHTVECCEWTADSRAACGSSTSPLHGVNEAAGSLLAAAFAMLRRGILTPLTTIWPPTFTRAA